MFKSRFLKIFSGSRIKIMLLISLFIFSDAKTYSQHISATAKIDSAEILIGRQAKLTLEVTHPKNQKIQWAEIPDTLGKVEIVERSKIDTLFSADSSSVINRQQFILTAFDSGYYVIPPFRFTDPANPDSSANFAETEPLLFTVKTIPVDTTKSIKDIKGPTEVPFSLEDLLPYILGVLVAAIVTVVSILLYRRFKKKPVTEAPKKPKRPAHEIAIEELKRLQEEKLWQKGDFKSYHTRLTDIIRLYLWHRSDVNAMEMTTDEILSNHAVKQVDSESFSKLKYMLGIADFVKFAKVIPVANENEQSLSNAFDFVTATKPVPVAEKAPEVKEVMP